MNYSWTQKTTQHGLLIEMRLQHVGESSILKVSDRVSDQSGWFINNNNPRVFINNFNRDGFWIEQLVGRLNKTQRNTLPREDSRDGGAAI